MTFSEALAHLKNGEKIARPMWHGFWVMVRDIYSRTGRSTVHMHCRDGRVLDIRDSEDVMFTLDNIAANDWEVIQ